MQRNSSVALCFAALILLWAGASHATAIVNGNFETGDLAGWTNSAGSLISVQTVSGVNYAQLPTGDSTGPLIQTLSQSLVLPVDEPILRFDFNVPDIQLDPTGTGASPFLDALFVSVFDGTNDYILLQLDTSGAFPDPFGTAPGAVTLGAPSNPDFDFGFSADLSLIVGETITLFFDTINEDDGFLSTETGVSSVTTDPIDEHVPEPTTGLLVFVGMIGMHIYARTLRRFAR